MIRSPISAEERLRNRVEEAEKRNSDLEHRVQTLEDTLLLARKEARRNEMCVDGAVHRVETLENTVQDLRTKMDGVFIILGRLLTKLGV